MQLYITEKPSVAKALADFFNTNGGAFKLTKDKSHYLDATQHIMITWAVGHLLALQEPHKYNPDWKSWNVNQLPIVPTMFKKFVKRSHESRYKAIQELLKTATQVVHAGDPDREGQSLIDELLEMTHYDGKVKRLLLNALDDKSIMSAMSSLSDNADYKGLSQSANARAYTDWLIGINLTRYYTAIARNGGYSNIFNVGRVMTPTLALIVERYLEVKNFKPEKTYKVEPIITVGEQSLSPTVKPIQMFLKESEAQALQLRLVGKNVTVQDIEINTVEETVKELYNLNTLQVAANKRLGFTPKETLATLQKLYEKKVTTYPRSDCKYLPESQLSDATAICKMINNAGVLPVAIPQVTLDNKPVVFNDKKITAHHAIIPTTKSITDVSLSDDERKLYALICEKYASVFFPPYTYKKKHIIFTVDGEDDLTLEQTTREVIDYGYKKLLAGTTQDEDKEDEAVDIDVAINPNDIFPIKTVGIKEGKTKPKKLYTSGSIIQAMTNISSDDPTLAKKLKEVKGIGTPATRADILDKLIEYDQIKLEGKNLIPTHQGLQLYQLLPDELKSAVYTALMELSLDEVEAGTKSVKHIIDDTTQLLLRLIQDVKPPVIYNEQFPCPQCHEGYLIKKAYRDQTSSTYIRYFRCTHCNRTFNADAEEDIPEYVPCTECKDGYIQEKRIRSGPKAGNVFYGCSNYPTCKKTWNADAYKKLAKTNKVTIENTTPSNFDNFGK